MDMNQLYFDHQLLRMQADRAPSPETTALHNRGAALVAGRIGCMQRAIGAYAAPNWTAIAATDPENTGYPQPLLSGPARGPIAWATQQQGAAA
jgi:hypothetical protein